MKLQKRRVSGIIQTVESFALGAAIGSLTALLFAPASGRVTRRRIGQRVRVMQQATTRQLGKVQRQLARKAEDLRDNATEKLHDAREWLVGHVTNGRRSLRPRAAHHA